MNPKNKLQIIEPKAPESVNYIPRKAALFDENYPDSGELTISFKIYEFKECELDNLSSSPLKKILKLFKYTSQNSTIKDLQKKNFNIKSIHNSGDYSQLFKNLPQEPDSQTENVYELIIGRSERLFFYLARRIMYIILIKNKHLESSKNFK